MGGHSAPVEPRGVREQPEEAVIRRAALLLLLALLTTDGERGPSIRLQWVPDAMPRNASDTLGRLEFELVPGEGQWCDDCTVSIRGLEPPFLIGPSISGGRGRSGMLGALPAGRYALRVTGLRIKPFEYAVRLQNRRTLRAQVYLAMRPEPSTAVAP
jgi:hypothetical protein